jgi:[acyl-carrier-protein] S-malonyltransferase
MIACLFPGQGSQEIGMAADLFHGDSPFRELVRHASRATGTDLERICLRGPERELRKTEFLQPLLVAVSLGYLRRLQERGLQPDVVLGHSLGEITALAAVGVLTFAQAVEVAAQRGRLMSQRAAQLEGGMMAVTATERERALAFLSKALAPERVYLANDNSPAQFVLSGLRSDLEEAARLLQGQRLGACRLLPVTGPWHSPLMKDVQEPLADWLRDLPWTAPRIPILMNNSASPEQSPDRIRDLVVRNLAEPALWRSSMDRLKEMRPSVLLEVGPGRVLSGLARANGFGDDVRVVPVNNVRGVDLALPRTVG